MIKFNEIAAEAVEREKAYMLAEFEIGEALDYHWPSIQDAINDAFMRGTWEGDAPVYAFNRTFSLYEREQITRYLIDNAADLLSIGYGYQTVTGYYPIASVDEIEIPLDETMRWTEKREEIVTRYSDMTIQRGYGYATAGFHLDIKVDPDTITAALLEIFE